MNEIEIAKWVVAGIFWTLALTVVFFNIKRHFSDRNISGVPFLFTIFTVIGMAVAPVKMYWIVVPGLLFEIPALINFKREKEEVAEETNPSDNTP
jgi:hypothetical protein